MDVHLLIIRGRRAIVIGIYCGFPNEATPRRLRPPSRVNSHVGDFGYAMQPPSFLQKKISKTAPLSFALLLVGRSVDLVDAPQGSGLVPSLVCAPLATFLRTPGHSAEFDGALLIRLVMPPIGPCDVLLNAGPN